MGVGVSVVVAVWLTALSICDVRQRRLPNFLTLPGAAAVLGVAALSGRGLPAFVGAAGLGGVYLLAHMTAPAGLGAGDVKLALGVGGLTGWFGVDVWALAALTAPLLTGVWALVEVVRRANRTVPHGPSMCVASAAAITLTML